MPFEHIAAAVFAEPWLIQPEKGRAIVELLATRLRGERLSPEEIRAVVAGRPAHDVEAVNAAAAAASAKAGSSAGAIAVVPIYGVMAPRVDAMEESSGAMSTTKILRSFRAAADDPRVSAIVLDIDSPGGSVYGTDELASEVYGARSKKPIVAVANTVAASAAYYVGSQAHELFVSPSGEVGSIGVFAEHWDYSGFLERAGMKPTIISAGKHKVEGHPYGPLDDTAREFQQARINEYYDAFVKAVGRGRGISAAIVRGPDFGEGRMFGAKTAVARGMADAVGTIDDAIARAASGRVKAGPKASSGPVDVFAKLTEWGAREHIGHRVSLNAGLRRLPGEPGDVFVSYGEDRLGDYWQCEDCATGIVAAPWASQDVAVALADAARKAVAGPSNVDQAARRLRLAELGA